MATDIQLERARYQIEGETDPHQCFDIHHELFGVYPDVTIVKMREGDTHLCEAVRKAIERGSPLTPEECEEVDRATFPEWYANVDKGNPADLL
ncbi:MAG: hypothetical protein MPL62_18200 [Alphaproteobacteria bacterium]|nr:hypothetical protein [Alphaproteobacteria bacterium]